MRSHKSQLVFLDTDDGAILADIDTPDDLQHTHSPMGPRDFNHVDRNARVNHLSTGCHLVCDQALI